MSVEIRWHTATSRKRTPLASTPSRCYFGGITSLTSPSIISETSNPKDHGDKDGQGAEKGGGAAQEERRASGEQHQNLYNKAEEKSRKTPGKSVAWCVVRVVSEKGPKTAKNGQKGQISALLYIRITCTSHRHSRWLVVHLFKAIGAQIY